MLKRWLWGPAAQKRAALWVIGVFTLVLCCACSGGAKEEIFDLDDRENGSESEEPGNGLRDLGTGGEISTQEESEPTMIYVYVCGAVACPGVVGLPEGSRAVAGVSAAGGLRQDADPDYVNLAAPLEDGQKLYIPTLEEGALLEKQQGGGSDLVDINTADVSALCTLPGIGESKAEDIVAYREANGPFGSIEDIMKVPGIKEAAFGKIKDRITV